MLNILYIEEDSKLVALIKSLLGSIAVVDSVVNVDGAHEQIAKNDYDIILINLDEGLFVIRSLSHSYPRIPIVVVGTAKNEDLLDLAAEAGASDYILDPWCFPRDFVDKLKFVHTRNLRTSIGQRIRGDTFETLKPFITCMHC